MWRLVLAAVAVGLLAGCSFLPSDPTACAFLGHPGTFAPETVTRARCAPVYVVNHEGGLTVFLARTPHLDGETLQWQTSGGESVNPSPGAVLSTDGTFWSFAHGERYDLSGVGIEGPVSRPLWRCPTETRGNQLWIANAMDASADEIVAICQRER
jgi:hypothetical protein